MPTQLLIDGYSLLFRAYHALPPLTTRSGAPTGAVHGFTAMLVRITEEERPDRLMVVFDAPQPTFRHEQYPLYKAQRLEAPDEFRQQVPVVLELLSKLGVPVLAVPGFEADDTLGTLALRGLEEGYQSLIVTGDRDLLQLARDGITILLTSRSGISDLDRLDRAGVKQKMGVFPEQVPDLKGLMGDSSDNIPGVAGIGQKSALALIEAYGTVENLVAHLDELTSARWQKALIGHEEEARRYRDLATIVTTVPIDWTPQEKEPFRWRVDQTVSQYLEEWELYSLKKKLGMEATEKPDLDVESGELLAAPQLVDEETFSWSSEVIYGTFGEEDALWIYHPGTNEIVKRVPGDFPSAPVQLAGWGVKEIYRGLLKEKRPLPHFVRDVKIEAYLIDSERREYAIEGLMRESRFHVSGDGAMAVAVSALTDRQFLKLKEWEMEGLYCDVELPLARILASMEAWGILVDRGRLSDLGEELKKSLGELEQEIYELSGGEPFNINSQRQLGEVLFSRLHLPTMKKTKTGYSTDAETLESLKPLHPIVEKILLYRQLMKVQGTYVDGLLPLIEDDMRIHTTYHQTVTATGRLSSSDPNLQNIPIRLPVGRRVREVFVPSSERTLLAADYSQIELRILAHLSGDENLIQAFVDGEDIHRRTASEIFNIPLDSVDATWRSRAKAVNFGIIYGISDFGLSRDTGVSRTEAKDYITRYYARYPKLKSYFEEIIAGAARDGYVTTILGRRRLLPEILSKNHVRRQYAERMATNTVIQGSAADLMKVAMLRIEEGMHEESFKSVMMLQVHDELIWDAFPDELPSLVGLARTNMTEAMTLTVPLVVEFKSGDNWESMHFLGDE